MLGAVYYGWIFLTWKQIWNFYEKYIFLILSLTILVYIHPINTQIVHINWFQCARRGGLGHFRLNNQSIMCLTLWSNISSSESHVYSVHPLSQPHICKLLRYTWESDRVGGTLGPNTSSLDLIDKVKDFGNSNSESIFIWRLKAF